MLEHPGDQGVDTGAPRSDWARLSAPPTSAWSIDSEQYRYLTACNQASLFILYRTTLAAGATMAYLEGT